MPEPFAPASPRFQLEQGYTNPDAPLAETPTSSPSIPPPRRDSGFSSGSRLRSPVDSLASQTAEWIEAPRSPDGSGPERSIPTLSRSNGRRRRKDDASRMEENSEGSYRRDSHPQMPEETGTGTAPSQDSCQVQSH
ncbi:hypothetical protein M407DRAFT_106916 [Tulasnella calospora MUT 4182]|uniref:Uncharacterized protein n=1 Tax=Tulasnella calospora MUT 4182 TaxID=1051891 RepID=A0A0C3LR44_9AGAM|nr:hypothetical protein M407DRAFT_106916 [Tulasnella calospora MUT 4182]